MAGDGVGAADRFEEVVAEGLGGSLVGGVDGAGGVLPLDGVGEEVRNVGGGGMGGSDEVVVGIVEEGGGADPADASSEAGVS